MTLPLLYIWYLVSMLRLGKCVRYSTNLWLDLTCAQRIYNINTYVCTWGPVHLETSVIAAAQLCVLGCSACTCQGHPLCGVCWSTSSSLIVWVVVQSPAGTPKGEQREDKKYLAASKYGRKWDDKARFSCSTKGVRLDDWNVPFQSVLEDEVIYPHWYLKWHTSSVVITQNFC